MAVLEDFLLNLQQFFIDNKRQDHNIIRRHTKKLDELGDISFPLNISNWYQFLGVKDDEQNKIKTIFSYKYPDIDKDIVVDQLLKKSCDWEIRIKTVVFRNNDIHIFFNKSSTLYNTIIKEVINANNNYGSSNVIKISIIFKVLSMADDSSLDRVDLSTLRMILLKNVATNFVNFCTCTSPNEICDIFFGFNPLENKNCVLSAPVLNEEGVKTACTANELYQKRSSDMRMMAQHKYGVQVKLNKAWESYFDNLGKGSVTIEMLTNKAQKCIKITPNDLQSANKGASFIFYNCARLAALFKEFERLISLKEYPSLPDIDSIDFSLLNQPEEWELFYVYIMQFPLVIKSCIKDIEKGNFNPQHLISFLSNLSSIFSVYYRRVRILTKPRQHMFSVIQARIYLLKALQCVFHNALRLLNIEPITEM